MTRKKVHDASRSRSHGTALFGDMRRFQSGRTLMQLACEERREALERRRDTRVVTPDYAALGASRMVRGASAPILGRRGGPEDSASPSLTPTPATRPVP